MNSKYLFAQPAFGYVVAVEKTKLGCIYWLFNDMGPIESKENFQTKDEALAKGLKAAEADYDWWQGFNACQRGQSIPLTASPDWIKGWAEAAADSGVKLSGMHLLKLQFRRMKGGEELSKAEVLAVLEMLIRDGYSDGELKDLIRKTGEGLEEEHAIACGEFN